MKRNATPSTRPAAKFTTEEAAEVLRIRPQTIRSGLCRDGHYLGMRPVKLANRRLLWPADAVERLISDEVAK